MSPVIAPPDRISRRETLVGGAGMLAALGGLGLPRTRAAHDDDPDHDHSSHFGVVRTYEVAADADVEELIRKAQGFVEIVRQVDGFQEYTIVYDDETRVWTAVGIFDDAESAQASTEAAADYVREQGLAAYFVDPTPEVAQGRIVADAGH